MLSQAPHASTTSLAYLIPHPVRLNSKSPHSASLNIPRGNGFMKSWRGQATDRQLFVSAVEDQSSSFKTQQKRFTSTLTFTIKLSGCLNEKELNQSEAAILLFGDNIVEIVECHSVEQILKFRPVLPQDLSGIIDVADGKVVEHICLLKAKENISDEGEKDMLDYLYTTQYQMGGIIAISLGRISEENLENCTHAVYMRFQKKEDLAKFYENPFYLRVLKEHVMPYCHGLFNVDFEAEVEDDILPIFRKGEEFNYGLEFVLLISFSENAIGGHVDNALASFARLTIGCPSLIVQSTQGLNLNPSSKEYTHGIVIRFRSFEAFEIFMGSSEYQDMWRSKFSPIIRKTLTIHFSVDPVGTEIM